MLDGNPLDFTMKAGTDRTIVLYLREKDDITGEISIVDPTGWTFYFEVRRSRTSATAYISKASTSATQIAITDVLDGEVQIYIKSTDFTVAPSYNTPYYCECIAITPGGQRFDIGDGNPMFLRSVVVLP
jgi:hypothetical protein